MSEYPKTENLLLRDEVSHKLIPNAFREEAFEQVGKWHVTEKIDGTNIRLTLDRFAPEHAEFLVQGRSDAANLPKGFIEEAVPNIDATLMMAALAIIDPDGIAWGMTVYGEGYGPGIQGGAALAEHKTLAIFDVKTYALDADGQPKPPLWRRWSDVEAVAQVLGIATAPVLVSVASIEQVIAFVEQRPHSTLGNSSAPMEGVVARSDPYLYTSRGNRVKFKLKAHDLA